MHVRVECIALRKAHVRTASAVNDMFKPSKALKPMQIMNFENCSVPFLCINIWCEYLSRCTLGCWDSWDADCSLLGARITVQIWTISIYAIWSNSISHLKPSPTNDTLGGKCGFSVLPKDTSTHWATAAHKYKPRLLLKFWCTKN